jgi:D-serine deaminase-like pyridoxal phosphate-dependent protein
VTAALAELPTPSLVVDVERCEENIRRVADAFSSHGVGLRPHVKTSKCLEVVSRQRAAGTLGFTCSTPAEVEAFGTAGFTGLLWAHQPVGPQKVAFAVEATLRWDVTLIADSVDVARSLSVEAVRRGTVADVMLDVDTGQHRTGVDPERAVAVGREIAALPGLRLAGVLTHEGHLGAYLADRPGLESAGRGVGALLASVAAGLRDAGLPCEVVSVGSTPGMTSSPYATGVTEGRPGTYVYFDANQVRLGSATFDQCALTVLARVVSRQRDGHAILDAGLKAMSSDSISAEVGVGVGVVCDLDATPLPDVTFPTANEEHGFLAGPGVNRLRVGDLVRVIPNHACGTTNMWSRLHAVSADGVKVWPIIARH